MSDNITISVNSDRIHASVVEGATSSAGLLQVQLFTSLGHAPYHASLSWTPGPESISISCHGATCVEALLDKWAALAVYYVDAPDRTHVEALFEKLRAALPSPRVAETP